MRHLRLLLACVLASCSGGPGGGTPPDAGRVDAGGGNPPDAGRPTPGLPDAR